MVDITKCANSEDCPQKHSCYRHTAPASKYHQSMHYFSFDGNECEGFYER